MPMVVSSGHPILQCLHKAVTHPEYPLTYEEIAACIRVAPEDDVVKRLIAANHGKPIALQSILTEKMLGRLFFRVSQVDHAPEDRINADAAEDLKRVHKPRAIRLVRESLASVERKRRWIAKMESAKSLSELGSMVNDYNAGR